MKQKDDTKVGIDFKIFLTRFIVVLGIAFVGVFFMMSAFSSSVALANDHDGSDNSWQDDNQAGSGDDGGGCNSCQASGNFDGPYNMPYDVGSGWTNVTDERGIGDVPTPMGIWAKHALYEEKDGVWVKKKDSNDEVIKLKQEAALDYIGAGSPCRDKVIHEKRYANSGDEFTVYSPGLMWEQRIWFGIKDGTAVPRKTSYENTIRCFNGPHLKIGEAICPKKLTNIKAGLWGPYGNNLPGEQAGSPSRNVPTSAAPFKGFFDFSKIEWVDKPGENNQFINAAEQHGTKKLELFEAGDRFDTVKKIIDRVKECQSFKVWYQSPRADLSRSNVGYYKQLTVTPRYQCQWARVGAFTLKTNREVHDTYSNEDMKVVKDIPAKAYWGGCEEKQVAQNERYYPFWCEYDPNKSNPRRGIPGDSVMKNGPKENTINPARLNQPADSWWNPNPKPDRTDTPGPYGCEHVPPVCEDLTALNWGGDMVADGSTAKVTFGPLRLRGHDAYQVPQNIKLNVVSVPTSSGHGFAYSDNPTGLEPDDPYDSHGIDLRNGGTLNELYRERDPNNGDVLVYFPPVVINMYMTGDNPNVKNLILRASANWNQPSTEEIRSYRFKEPPPGAISANSLELGAVLAPVSETVCSSNADVKIGIATLVPSG